MNAWGRQANRRFTTSAPSRGSACPNFLLGRPLPSRLAFQRFNAGLSCSISFTPQKNVPLPLDTISHMIYYRDNSMESISRWTGRWRRRRQPSRSPEVLGPRGSRFTSCRADLPRRSIRAKAGAWRRRIDIPPQSPGHEQVAQLNKWWFCLFPLYFQWCRWRGSNPHNLTVTRF